MSGLFYIQGTAWWCHRQLFFLKAKRTIKQFLRDTAAAPGVLNHSNRSVDGQPCGVLVASEYAASRVKVLHANIERAAA